MSIRNIHLEGNTGLNCEQTLKENKLFSEDWKPGHHNLLAWAGPCALVGVIVAVIMGSIWGAVVGTDSGLFKTAMGVRARKTITWMIGRRQSLGVGRSQMRVVCLYTTHLRSFNPESFRASPIIHVIILRALSGTFLVTAVVLGSCFAYKEYEYCTVALTSDDVLKFLEMVTDNLEGEKQNITANNKMIESERKQAQLQIKRAQVESQRLLSEETKNTLTIQDLSSKLEVISGLKEKSQDNKEISSTLESMKSDLDNMTEQTYKTKDS